MTEDGDNNGSTESDKQSIAGGKASEHSKEVTDGIKEKGKTGDETSGEDGGYGYIRPSAESGGSGNESGDSNSE